MNALEWKLNVKTFFFPQAIWWTVLREGLEFTLNLFMHVVKKDEEKEDINAECLSLFLNQPAMVGDRN